MPVDPRRVKELFVAGLDLADEPARQAFLDRECAGDADLRRRLEDLLRAHDQAQPALDQPLAAVEATTADLQERPGMVLAGKYKLIEQIGEGGMGSVWMAQQTEPVKRIVAVKLIKAEADSSRVLARFEAERQALALMDHPNIARVLDAGTIGSPLAPREDGSPLAEREDYVGRPFFVMELVKGVPITKFCDARKLTPRQRLELFIPVCQAIQHAHQKGIIHRDIKPSNVLVALYDDRPVPKVIDFGVAKATGQQLTEQTLHTGFGAIVGTPQYMSPEQATLNNLDIDTRSDIYSLGVLLYELLAGSPPFRGKELEKAGVLEMLRVIREEEPPKPSTKVSTAEALPSLAAHRSTEPAKLTRLLRGEIDWIVMKSLEKERSRRYETANGLAMDIQRYLADEPVLAGPPSATYRLRKFVKRHKGQVVAVGLVLLALLAGIAGTTVGLVRAEKAREAEAQRAEGERSAKIDAENAAQAEKKAKEDAENAAKAETAAKEQAEKRLKQIEKGIEILTSVFHDLDPKSEEKEGESLRVLLGKRLDTAVEQLEGEAVGDPVVVARLQSQLGNSLRELGHFDRAETVLTKARQTLETHLGANHPYTLSTKNNLALLYQNQGKYPDAETLFKEVLAAFTAKFGADHLDTLSVKTNLADLYDWQRNLTAAETLNKEVLNLTAKFGADHPLIVLAKNNLALLYLDQGNYPAAETLFKEALAVQTAQLGADHPDTLAIKNNLAGVYLGQKKYTAAETLYKEVIESLTAKFGADHPLTLGTKNRLARLYWFMKKLDHSIPLFEALVEQRKKISGASHPDTLVVVANLGVNYRDAGRLDDGIRCLEEAMTGICKLPDPKPAQLAGIPGMMAQTYDQAKQHAKSEPLYRDFLQQGSKLFGDDDPRTAGLMAQLAMNLLLQKKHADAEKTLRDCLSIREKKQPDDWSTFNTRSMLGEALLGQKKYTDAEPLLKDGYVGIKQRQDKIPEVARKVRLTEALQRLVQLYEATDKKDEAAKWRKELAALQESEKKPQP